MIGSIVLRRPLLFILATFGLLVLVNLLCTGVFFPSWVSIIAKAEPQRDAQENTALAKPPQTIQFPINTEHGAPLIAADGMPFFPLRVSTAPLVASDALLRISL